MGCAWRAAWRAAASAAAAAAAAAASPDTPCGWDPDPGDAPTPSRAPLPPGAEANRIIALGRGEGRISRRRKRQAALKGREQAKRVLKVGGQERGAAGRGGGWAHICGRTAWTGCWPGTRHNGGLQGSSSG